MDRIDMVEIAVIVTSFDDKGRITNQRKSQPVVVFKANTPDVWAHLDSLVDGIAKQE